MAKGPALVTVVTQRGAQEIAQKAPACREVEQSHRGAREALPEAGDGEHAPGVVGRQRRQAQARQNLGVILRRIFGLFRSACRTRPAKSWAAEFWGYLFIKTDLARPRPKNGASLRVMK